MNRQDLFEKAILAHEAKEAAKDELRLQQARETRVQFREACLTLLDFDIGKEPEGPEPMDQIWIGPVHLSLVHGSSPSLWGTLYCSEGSHQIYETPVNSLLDLGYLLTSNLMCWRCPRPEAQTTEGRLLDALREFIQQEGATNADPH